MPSKQGELLVVPESPSESTLTFLLAVVSINESALGDDDALGVAPGVFSEGATSSKSAGRSNYKYTPKSNPNQKQAGGIDTEDLKQVVAQEMAQLKMFIKEVIIILRIVTVMFLTVLYPQVKGTKPGPESNMKTYFRDK